MALTPILEQPHDFAFFGGIDREALLTVSDLFESGSYPPGTRIIEEGSSGNRLFIITAGKVEVSVRCNEDGGSIVEANIATHGRGATFGEMELLDTQSRSASVTALEPVATIELTNMGLYQIFLRDPEIFRMVIMNLARDLSRRLRLADQQLALVRIDPDPA